MRIVEDYREDAGLRGQLNALTRQVYGFDFEAWYRAGHWGERYQPCSALVDGRIVANASANIMDCVLDGQPLRLIQIGTVMTHPDYRGRGYSRALLEALIDRWLPRCDGLYLYPNDTVQQFYPRFGFEPGAEFCCRAPGPVAGRWNARPVSPEDAAQWRRFSDAVYAAAPQGRLWVDNPGLVMFYAGGDNVFFLPELDAYAVAERDEGGLTLQQVIAGHPVDAMDAARALGGGAVVRFGFSPMNAAELARDMLGGAEIPVFTMGEGPREIARRGLGLPVLSHA